MSDRRTSSCEVARRCLESPEFPATEAATPRVLIVCDDPEFAADVAQAGAARGLIVESFCTAAAAVRRLTEKPVTPTGDADVIRFPTSPAGPALPGRARIRPARRSSAGTAAPVATERTVVLVDGSDALVAMLSYTARPAATRCLAFQDGGKAMAWLMNGEAPRDAVIVFDLDLAGIDTQDAVRRLAGAEGHRYRVLATTAGRSEATQVAALRAGAVDCLLKPFSFPLFAAKVERLLAVP